MDFTELFEHFSMLRETGQKAKIQRPPDGLVDSILKCANFSKVAGALQRLIFVLMQGEPTIKTSHPSDEPIDVATLNKFLRSAAWSLLVFNMAAFIVNVSRDGTIRPVCVPISENNIRRFRNAKTGDLVYFWAKQKQERQRAMVFSVNPADLGNEWFSSPVMHLRTVVESFQMMLANYLHADFSLSNANLVLAYKRSNLFAARAMGDSTVGDISENNAEGVQTMMHAISQAVSNDLDINPNAVLSSTEFDLNASKRVRATTTTYFEAGPSMSMNTGLKESKSLPYRPGNSNLLFITPGYEPAGGVTPSRNPEFLKNMIVEREISAQLGVPMGWLTESSSRQSNVAESEGDSDKLKISIEILRRHLTDLMDVVQASVKKRRGMSDEDSKHPDEDGFQLIWQREIQFHFVYTDRQTQGRVDCDEAPRAKRVKTEAEEEVLSTESDGESDESADDNSGTPVDVV